MAPDEPQNPVESEDAPAASGSDEVVKQADGPAGQDPQVADLEAALQEAETQATEYLDRLQRLQADFQNFRRRKREEQADALERALDPVLRDILEVLDNLERALDAPAGDGAALRHGVELTRRQLVGLLAGRDVSAEEPEGEAFDPMRHEAILREETAEHPEGTVLEVLLKGYVRGERVLRPARVRVAVAPPAASPEDATGSASATGEGPPIDES